MWYNSIMGKNTGIKGEYFMKKLVAVLLAVMMLLGICSCGAKKQEEQQGFKTVQELFDNGYQRMAGAVSRGKFKALFGKEDMSSYYMLSTEATAETEQAYNALDIFEDTYEEDFNNFLKSLENITLEDISAKIPGEETLKKFVGKTLADIEAEGFFESGSMITDDEAVFTYQNDEYICDLDVDVNSIQNDDESTYVVKAASFCGLASDIIMEPFDEKAMLARVESEKSVKAFYDNLFAAETSIPEADGDFVIRFTSEEDGRYYIYKVTTELTADDLARYNELEDLEDFEERFNALEELYCGLKIKEIQDLKDKVPAQEELDKYVGKTAADLEADGLTEMKEYAYGDSRYFKNDTYLLMVTMEEGTDTVSEVSFAYLY